MMRVVLIFLVPLLVGCGVASAIIPTAPPSPLPSAHGFSLEPSAWSIQYSRSMPSSPSQAAGGWYFDFPQGPEADGAASVHYVTTPSGGGLASSSWLGAVFEIAETGAAVYQYKLKADNTCDNPAIVSLFLQQQGVSLLKTRFERTDGGARQESDARQCFRTARSGVCRARPSRAKREFARHYNRRNIS
jgi:hypothetical protein